MPDLPLCPREEASPRAKANLMRAIFTGRLERRRTASRRFKSVADLCVNCHQCRLECPAERRHSQADDRNARRSTSRPTGSRRLTGSSLASIVAVVWCQPRSPLTNWASRNRQMRWMMEKDLGIAQGRKLPRLASRSFLRLAHRRRLTRPDRRSGHKVLYFVDIYANWYDLQLAEALVAVLEHNGVAVYVHPGQVPSGMAALGWARWRSPNASPPTMCRILAEAVRRATTSSPPNRRPRFA